MPNQPQKKSQARKKPSAKTPSKQPPDIGKLCEALSLLDQMSGGEGARIPQGDVFLSYNIRITNSSGEVQEAIGHTMLHSVLTKHGVYDAVETMENSIAGMLRGITATYAQWVAEHREMHEKGYVPAEVVPEAPVAPAIGMMDKTDPSALTE